MTLRIFLLMLFQIIKQLLAGKLHLPSAIQTLNLISLNCVCFGSL